MTPRATVITDASFCPKTKAAGWASWIVLNLPHGTYRVKAAGQFKDPPVSSTQAEWKALLNGLHLAYARGARRILLQTDCMSVVNGKGFGKVNFQEFTKARFPEAEIDRRHVRGHTTLKDARSYVNRWCDAQARAAMEDYRLYLRTGSFRSAAPFALYEETPRLPASQVAG